MSTAVFAVFVVLVVLFVVAAGYGIYALAGVALRARRQRREWSQPPLAASATSGMHLEDPDLAQTTSGPASNTTDAYATAQVASQIINRNSAAF